VTARPKGRCWGRDQPSRPWQCLYFLPDPQGQGALRPVLPQVEGSSDPARRAHQELLANTGHRRNMLDDRFELVGVGVARSSSTYWITQVYLRP